VAHQVEKRAHVGHAEGKLEVGEHRFVIGRVAAEHELLVFRVQIAPEQFAGTQAGGREFVEIAEPAVHVDRGDLGVGAVVVEDGLNPQHVLARQGRHILAEINGQIVFAVLLVGSDGATGYLGQDFAPDALESRAVGGPLFVRIQIAASEFFSVVVEIESAIFAHHRGHGPEPGDVVAPAGGPAGDRHHLQPGARQAPERLVGVGQNTPLRRDGFVNVGEDTADTSQIGWGK
jgi:hypothetical protein